MGEGDEQRRVLICREVDTNFDGIKDVVRVYNDSGEPTVEAADADYDGKMDVWITFQGGKPSKTEVDTNRDGRPDEVRYYLNGHLRRAQRDTNFDGKPDVWEIYDDGRLQRLGEDLDFDGFVDRWSRDEILAREAEARENAGAPAPPVPGSPAARAEPAGEASGSPTKKKGEKTKRH